MSSKPKVLVTREGEGIAEQLEQKGFEPIILPLITIQPIAHPQMKDDYQWIFFTSKNAVKYFFSHEKLPPTTKIAVIGEKTKLAVESFGYQVNFMPSAFDGDTFLKEIKETVQPGEKVLFPKGNLARQDISATLKKQDILMHDMIVYETKLAKEKKEKLIVLLKNKQVDIIMFASPSAVENFTRLLEGTSWQAWIQSIQIACIGPATKQKAMEARMNPEIVPSVHTFSALADELAKQLEED